MVKVSEVIKHLQEYQDQYGDMPVYISSKDMPKNITINPLMSTNVMFMSNDDDPNTKTHIGIRFIVLSDEIINPDGESIHDEREESKHE